MTHEEFKRDVKKQRRFINWMLNGRKKVSEKIDCIVKERYSDLIGKFFVPKEKIKNLDPNEVYCVRDAYAISNYVSDDTVKIVIEVSTLGKSYDDFVDEDNNSICSVFVWSKDIVMTPDEDFEEMIKDCIISFEEAMKNHIVKDLLGLINNAFPIKEEN